MSPAASTTTQQQRRGYWLRTLHQWHWISAAICLVAMLLFSITGITLNHASSIEAKPAVETRTATMPESVLKTLGAREEGHAPLPATASELSLIHI